MSEIFGRSPRGIRDPRQMEMFVASKTRSGGTLFTRKPILDPRPEFNGSEKSMRKIIRRAVTYAELACDQLIYQSKAVGRSNSAYTLAVADYLEKPKVLDIVIEDWTYGTGQAIQIKAKDDLVVISVRLVIRDAEGILEEGQAQQSTSDSLLWTYLTKTPVTREQGVILDAYAYDLPGNVGEYHLELR